MKTHRCFHDAALSSGDVITLVDTEAHHLLRVRRARPGDRILVINGRGVEFEARLLDSNARLPALELRAAVRVEEQPPLLPVLAPVLTPDTESLITTAVELGVGGFRPLISARCTVRGARKRPEQLAERWRRLAITAIKQCERLWLPVISPPCELEPALKEMLAAGERPVCLVERTPVARPLMECLASLGPTDPTILIGPEGGWDSAELQIFAHSAIPCATLGDAILRAETAALAALASSLAHRTSLRV